MSEALPRRLGGGVAEPTPGGAGAARRSGVLSVYGDMRRCRGCRGEPPARAEIKIQSGRFGNGSEVVYDPRAGFGFR